MLAPEWSCLPYTQTESVAMDIEDTRPDVARRRVAGVRPRRAQARLAAGKPIVGCRGVSDRGAARHGS
jgi:hypothetical protein